MTEREYTKEDLEKLGFVMIPGILEDALRAKDVYGFYEILPNEKAFLSMKNMVNHTCHIGRGILQEEHTQNQN